MKIVFLALSGTFDYHQIGGTDSYMRRLSDALTRDSSPIRVKWLFYGDRTSRAERINDKFEIRRFRTFQDAICYLRTDDATDVVCCYIRPTDRLRFWWHSRRYSSKGYHILIFFYPKSSWVKIVRLAELSLLPYNGNVICVSERQRTFFEKYVPRVAVVPPIVPSEYYESVDSKNRHDVINVTFIGRIDPRKGILEVIDVFNRIVADKKFKLTIYGTVIPQDRQAYKIHRKLRKQSKITYRFLERKSYTADTDRTVRQALAETDIFLQPFVTLESTVDTPLLVLEAMASLCVVLTTDIGDILNIHGNSKYVITGSFPNAATAALKRITCDEINCERYRLQRLNSGQKYCEDGALRSFLHAISR